MAEQPPITVYGTGLPPGDYEGRWTGLGAFHSLLVLVPKVSENAAPLQIDLTPSDTQQSDVTLIIQPRPLAAGRDWPE